MINFQVGKTYNFETIAPGILPSAFKNAYLLGELTFETASRQDNIDLKYRQIFPILPPGSLDNPKKQRWFNFKAENGSEVILCGQWISESSVVEVSSISLDIHVANVTAADAQRIRALLNSAGYKSFTIS